MTTEILFGMHRMLSPGLLILPIWKQTLFEQGEETIKTSPERICTMLSPRGPGTEILQSSERDASFESPRPYKILTSEASGEGDKSLNHRNAAAAMIKNIRIISGHVIPKRVRMQSYILFSRCFKDPSRKAGPIMIAPYG